ncbi:hypothetical protein ABC977_06825 [Thioalkalicoccus limnaeus]|uniref:Uncharacterized protein n=1 Tax=Thioalkalicoccus limnaeus TaxID=120681 RepID=A0ABV4BDP1_9GAMM
MADLTTGVRLRFAHGPYRSPIFLSNGQAILALSGNNLIQIHQLGAEPTLVATIPGVVKLVGAHREDPNQLLVLITDADGEAIRPAVFDRQERRVVRSPPQQDQTEQRLVPHLLGDDREYGDRRLSVREEHGEVEGVSVTWTDVFIETAGVGEARNISRCRPASCRQPSLSPDGGRVVYVKGTGE